MCAFRVTSDATAEYNCVSWAVQHQRQAIWPDEEEQLGWPQVLPREETIAAFQRFFEMAGFSVSGTGLVEAGQEKIAIYVKDGKVKHTARQLPTGEWTSKMGGGPDGSHPADEFGDMFGGIALFMTRPATGLPPVLPPLNPPPARLIHPGGAPLIR